MSSSIELIKVAVYIQHTHTLIFSSLIYYIIEKEGLVISKCLYEFKTNYEVLPNSRKTD